MQWLFRTTCGQSTALTDLSHASIVPANMLLQCPLVATGAGNMGWTQGARLSLRRCSLVTTVESCWQAKWNCRLTLRLSTKAGGTSSAGSVTRPLPQNQTSRFMKARCTQGCCPTDVTFVRKCLPGEVNWQLTRRANIPAMPDPSLSLRMSTLSRCKLVSWLTAPHCHFCSSSNSNLDSSLAGWGYHHSSGRGWGWWGRD